MPRRETPRVPRKTRAIVTPAQFEEIYTHLPNDAARLLVETDIETGLRWGELTERCLSPDSGSMIWRRTSRARDRWTWSTGAKGGPLRSQIFSAQSSPRRLRRSAFLGPQPRELRHTAASLAIASGASVKVVQQMLGHKTATMTLDLYGHLYGDQLDEVGDRVDGAAKAARGRDADYLRTDPRTVLALGKATAAEGA